MPTLPNRLRIAAQYTGLDSMRELLIEAAGALDVRHASDCAPQPKERKPLTDEQITAACSAAHATCKLNTRIRWSVVFTRAIEAAHGIKD